MSKKIQGLKEVYKKTAVPQLTKEYQYTNQYQVPRIEKVILNMGLGSKLGGNTKAIENAVNELSMIANQKAVPTIAKKSIATFKVREGMTVGCKVTLRKDNMYNFLDKFVYGVLPRMRDFRGFSGKAFDGRGNYTIGFKEYTYFPEIDFDSVDVMKGLDITIVTTAKTNEEAKALLLSLNFPFNN